jgi:hypothetical protein
MLENSVFIEGTTDYYHALAKAEELVRTSRSAASVKFEYVLKTKYLEPGDIVKLESQALNLGIDSPFYVRIEEVKLTPQGTCEVSATRFDYTQLAWNIKDNEYIKPNTLYNFGITAPSTVTYVQGNNELRNSPGTLFWDLVPDPRLSGYIIYFHTFTDNDTDNRPIFREIGRVFAPPYYVPDLGSTVGVWGVAAYTPNTKSAITPVSTSIVDRIDSELDPPTPTGFSASFYGDFEQAIKLTWDKATERSNGIPYKDHKFFVVERAPVPPLPDDIPPGWVPPPLEWESIGITSEPLFIDNLQKYGKLSYRVKAVSLRDLSSAWSTTITVFVDPLKAANAKTAVVYAYKRSSAAPTDNPGEVTYSFVNKGFVFDEGESLANGWSATIPTGTNPLYVTAATAFNGGETDLIKDTEWSTPVLMSQSGLNSAMVFLYQRSNSATPPTVNSDGVNAVYTFSTATLTNIPSGWSTSVPSSGGKYLYVTQATAVSVGTTDTITDAEWATVTLLAQNGDNGTAGPAGSNSYFHIKFSNDGGSTFTGNNGEDGGTYIGVYSDGNAADSNSPGAYSWTLIKGNDGTDGTPGTPGSNGLTPYLHIKYSNNGGASFTGNNGEDPGDWMGTYTDYIVADSNSPGAYTWVRIKGDTGSTGPTGPTGQSNHRVYIAAAVNSPPATPSPTTNGATPSGWSATPVTLSTGQAQFQSDGVTPAGTTTTVWGVPYQSYFKVGSLDAITATIGTFRSAPSGSRVEISDQVIKIFEGSSLRVQIGNLSL